MYTLSVKRNITSSGRRSLESTASRLIIFGHKLVLLNEKIWKTQDFLVSKGENAVESRRVIFRKSQKLLSELHGGSLFKTFKSYSFNFNGGLRKRRTGFCLLRTPSPRGKQFLWFLTIDLLWFHRIYLLYDWNKRLFFVMCLWRINLPNLCPNMIHVDALDFGGWHSKELSDKFLLTVSVVLVNSENKEFLWWVLFVEFDEF